MDVLKWNELNSGAAEMTIQMTEEEQRFLIEYAINDILKKKLEKIEKDVLEKGPPTVGDFINGTF